MLQVSSILPQRIKFWKFSNMYSSYSSIVSNFQSYSYANKWFSLFCEKEEKLVLLQDSKNLFGNFQNSKVVHFQNSDFCVLLCRGENYFLHPESLFLRIQVVSSVRRCVFIQVSFDPETPHQSNRGVKLCSPLQSVHCIA